MMKVNFGVLISQLEFMRKENYEASHDEFMKLLGKDIQAHLMSEITYALFDKPEQYECGLIDGKCTYLDFTLTMERKLR